MVLGALIYIFLVPWVVFGNRLGMIKDRYGSALFSENTITVFDPSLDYDTEVFEDTLGLKLRDFDRELYAEAYEVDFGAGADWPSVAYAVLENLVPFSAIAGAFFLGERIEKSVHAWTRMASALLSCIPDGGFTDANGAALLALEKVSEHVGCSEVSLLAYTWVDTEVAFFDEPDKAKAAFNLIEKLDEIEPREKQFKGGLHAYPTFLFKFEAGDVQVLAAVKQKTVSLVEL